MTDKANREIGIEIDDTTADLISDIDDDFLCGIISQDEMALKVSKVICDYLKCNDLVFFSIYKG